ncbi:MAG TPA: BTAD domain-containing putative transcriptional regulator [Acetobacteraceae bacterium]|nr:BTAD domain-containing putative transcriptional regulator [Acetobacteraceae bacterium]
MTVLASFSLRVGTSDIRDLPRKARALLAYLGSQPGRRFSREAAADLLWTDRGPKQARHSLRQSLLVLRRTPAGGLIQTDADAIWIDAGSIWVDSLAMEMALADSSADALSYGASLYRGPLLADMPPVSPGFDDWVRPERARLAAIATETLRQLSAVQIESGNSNAAIATAARLVGLDPLNEAAHRLRMTYLARCGRRAEALLQFESCAQILNMELDVSPDQDTMALAEQIRAGTLAPTGEPRDIVSVPQHDGPPGRGSASIRPGAKNSISAAATPAACANDSAPAIVWPRAVLRRRQFATIVIAVCLAGLLTAGLMIATGILR